MISSRLEKLLRIPASQQGRTGLLFLFAFGMSGAYVCARADADAMFLSRVGVQRLPAMILVAASAVAILSAVYSRLVAKASLRRVILFTHLLLASVTIGLTLLIESGYQSDAISESFYLLAELRGAIGSIQFATLLNEMFHRSAPAEVSGVAGSGATLAGIVLGGAIGFLAAQFGATSVLFLIPVLDVMAGLVAMRCPGRVQAESEDSMAAGEGDRPSEASRREDVHGPNPDDEDSEDDVRQSPLQILRTAPLARYLAMIICLKSVVVLLIEFEWKSAAGHHFAKEDDMASFFGVFYAGMFFLTGLLQLFGTSRVLTRSGIRTGLAAFPGCLSVVLTGVLFSSGATMFWWLAFARGCDTIRRSVTDPAINILYWPLNQNVRRQAIAFNGGWVKPLSEALTAVLLIPLAAALTQQGRAGVVLVVSAIWMFMIYRGRSAKLGNPGDLLS